MTYQTKSKIFVRDDGEAGLQVFSPYTGLFYNVPAEDRTEVLEWLDGHRTTVSQCYLDSIGLLWKTTFAKVAEQSLIHVPTSTSVSIDRLLVINWLITGKCTHKCPYCYAQDMRELDSCITTETDVDRMVSIILSYSPLAVVISGGEPLLHPFFCSIIKKLHGKTGIIVDTNGILLTEELVQFLKEKDVVVRISVDSLIDKNDRITRQICDRKRQPDNLSTVLKAVELCIRKELALVIHTVVTAANKNDLLSMGEKLYCVGVHVWKLMQLVDIKTNETKRLAVSYQSSEHFSRLIKHSVNAMWQDRMRVIIQENNPRSLNATVLVSPDGHFLTQAVSGNKKIPLDPSYPNMPREEEIRKRLDLWEHRKRYMGE